MPKCETEMEAAVEWCSSEVIKVAAQLVRVADGSDSGSISTGALHLELAPLAIRLMRAVDKLRAAGKGEV